MHTGGMKTREQIIRESAPKKVLEEIEAIFETATIEEWESIQNFEEAFDHLYNLADEGNFPYRADFRRIAIALGDYQEMTQEEIDSSVCLGCKPWDFKLGGKAYKFVR